MSKIYLMFIVFLIIINCSLMLIYRNLNSDEIFKNQFCEVKYKFLNPTEKSIAAVYGDKTNFLCCNNCKVIFEKNILKFIRKIILTIKIIINKGKMKSFVINK